MGRPDEVAEVTDAVVSTPLRDTRGDLPRGPRIGEGRRADLHGRRTGEEQLDGIERGADAAHPHDGQIGQRLVDVEHRSDGHGMDGPTRQATALRTESASASAGTNRTESSARARSAT